jgi:hypothetical protein
LIDLALDARRVRYAPTSKASSDILTASPWLALSFARRTARSDGSLQTVASLSAQSA